LLIISLFFQIFAVFKKHYFYFALNTKYMILENVDVVNDISKEDFQKNYFKKQNLFD
jgi:hypothetical protein